MKTDADATTRLPVFADVDTGVDDAMAIAYLLGSADAEIVGIASTAGNVPVDQVCVNNLGRFGSMRMASARLVNGPVTSPTSSPGYSRAARTQAVAAS